MSDDRYDDREQGTEAPEPTWNEYVEMELDRLLRTYACLRCRMNRRVMGTMNALEKLVRHNADERMVMAMAECVKEANIDAQSAYHDCGIANGP